MDRAKEKAAPGRTAAVEAEGAGRVPLSILDLSPIRQGGSAAESLACTIDLARHADEWGYHRFWLAEHHNIPGVASAATSVLIARVAAETERIRVGAGGIMLPNHAPLVIAEQFGTLELLYPGRIDLGLGRAPGGDMRTAAALRRHLGSSGDSFARDVDELRAYFRPGGPTADDGDPPGQWLGVHAIPGEGLEVPIYILGSSDYGARLAARLGVPYAFASHFAPTYLFEALALYRSRFARSEGLAKPYVIVGVNVFCAETEAEARRLVTSMQQTFLHLLRNQPREIPPPVEPSEMDRLWSPQEANHIRSMMRCSAVGTAEQVREQLVALIQATGADELIVASQIFDPEARLRSYRLLAEGGNSSGASGPG